MRPKGLMRVVGGHAKGRRLKGTVSPGGRPTTERVRAAIFNMLHPEVYQDRQVLDLFAGSGSLGIEALSLGAANVVFVERDRRQCDVIRSNLESTGFDNQGQVRCADVNKFLRTSSGPYQLVLMDPPYKMENLDQVLETLTSAMGVLEDGSMVVVGHSRFFSSNPEYGPLHLESTRRYGDNVVDIYRQGGD